MLFGAVMQRYEGPSTYKKAMRLYTTITLSPAPVVFSSKEPDHEDERVYSLLVDKGWVLFQDGLYAEKDGVKPRNYRDMCNQYDRFELIPPREKSVTFPKEGSTDEENEELFARLIALGATKADMHHRP